MKEFTVYKHTSPNGKIYVGITSMPTNARWKNGNGYKNNEHFWNAICKYGWENISHEIIADGLLKEDAEEMEKRLIAEYKSADRKFGYNIQLGGGSRFVAEETRQKLREAGMRQKHAPMSKEARERLSRSRLGSNNPFFGCHRTEEEKKAISAFHTGRKRPYETRKKISDAWESNRSKYEKPVLQFSKDGEFISRFASATDVQQKLGFSQSNVGACCRGKYKSAYGYVWKFE